MAARDDSTLRPENKPANTMGRAAIFSMLLLGVSSLLLTGQYLGNLRQMTMYQTAKTLPSSSSSSSLNLADSSATVTTFAGTAPLLPTPPSQAELDDFIDNFVAANPKYQDECQAYLRSPWEFNKPRHDYINWRNLFSQYNQDWFAFVNFFYQMTIQGHKGLYVESGANDPWRVSNTAFLDYCLGWKGLCIEPTVRHHEKLQTQRSCELITNCLSDIEGQVIYINNEEIKEGSQVGTKVECRRLENILKERNITNVDLWSLDVEGFEFKALSGLSWGHDINIQAILMEQQEMTSGICMQMGIDYRLTTLGYHKYRLVSDAFYYKAHDHHGSSPLMYADTNINNGSGSHTQRLDGYFTELEQGRCRKIQQQVKFFTDQQAAQN